ncbi:cold-shock protein [Streptomyces lichenis]|uniref:Cold shock domain-containing protein n=1 Tax=Streptomyces lichenis TaxID=2306967 RepID=A0ABT0I7A1_9ACTN|nr:cold shock domain-containing protein [Streptomyces lichenis]MCK8677185.1 cold shock domain-containing protein [Streptomyces lichenis]
MPERAMSGVPPEQVHSGHVRAWHREEGWGVLGTPSLPEEVWAHYSLIEAGGGGFRELTVGEAVTFTAERAEQDGFHWRAVSIRTSDPQPLPRDGRDTEGPGFTSCLDITFDS